MAKHTLLAEQHRSMGDGVLVAGERIATLLRGCGRRDLGSDLEDETAD
jgi:hypothetical protein